MSSHSWHIFVHTLRSLRGCPAELFRSTVGSMGSGTGASKPGTRASIALYRSAITAQPCRGHTLSAPQSAGPLLHRGRLPAMSKYSKDLLASVVVFLVALPLCMGISIASGVPPAAGLITGIIGGIVVGSLSGAPLQVSGPAAGLTVLVSEMIRDHGIESLGPIVLLGGLLQIVAGRLHFG